MYAFAVLAQKVDEISRDQTPDTETVCAIGLLFAWLDAHGMLAEIQSENAIISLTPFWLLLRKIGVETDNNGRRTIAQHFFASKRQKIQAQSVPVPQEVEG
jgi:hypothetical protein